MDLKVQLEAGTQDAKPQSNNNNNKGGSKSSNSKDRNTNKHWTAADHAAHRANLDAGMDEHTQFHQRSKEEKRCHCCGSKNHLLPQCQHKDSTPADKWHQKTGRCMFIESQNHSMPGDDNSTIAATVAAPAPAPTPSPARSSSRSSSSSSAPRIHPVTGQVMLLQHHVVTQEFNDEGSVDVYFGFFKEKTSASIYFSLSSFGSNWGSAVSLGSKVATKLSADCGGVGSSGAAPGCTTAPEGAPPFVEMAEI